MSANNQQKEILIPISEGKVISQHATQIDVSQRALSIARQIDRLANGSTYIIRLEKDNQSNKDWNVVIEGVIRIKELKAYEPKEKP